jgi:hypothetical protein
MAKNVVETRAEETNEVGTGATRGQGWRGRGRIAAVAALLTVVLIGSAVMHDRQARHSFVASEQPVCDRYNVSSPCYQSSMLSQSDASVTAWGAGSAVPGEYPAIDAAREQGVESDALTTEQLQDGSCADVAAPCVMP